MKYRHLFFDLDHTLWDHHRNSNETLVDLYSDYQLSDLGDFTATQFQETFHKINFGFWDAYHRGDIDQATIRQERFPRVLQSLGVQTLAIPRDLGTDYLFRCPRKPHLMPYALEVLEYLHEHYPMSVITNGFSEIQEVKLHCSGLSHFFHLVVTSETAGSLKPHPGIFAFAIDQIKLSPQLCVMIGDNPLTDIAGARDVGMDQIYYDPMDHQKANGCTHRVNCLRELKDLL